MLQGFSRDDFRIIATFADSQDNDRVIANTESAIATVPDLRGKKIGYVKGTSAHFLLEILLVEHGLIPSQVEVVEIKPVDMPKALADRHVDAITIWEPYATLPARRLLRQLTECQAQGNHPGTTAELTGGGTCMTIRAKLQISAGLLIGFAAATGVMLFMVSRVLTTERDKTTTAHQLAQEIWALNALTNDYVFHQGERAHIQWQSQYASIAALLTDQHLLFTTPREKAILEVARQDHTSIKDIFARLAALRGALRQPGAEASTTIALSSELEERIVERHDGCIWAEGRPGEGATFYFTLPMERRTHHG
jgi:hypothetical protein